MQKTIYIKTSLSVIIIILVELFSQNCYGQYSIKKPFDTGFEKGFTEGFCYNQKLNCVPPITPIVPLVRVGESENSYQDGFNRGFQIGLDLQRVRNSLSNSGSTAPSYENVPNYRFNDYIPQLPIKEMANVAAYKEALFKKRIQILQEEINNFHDLNYSLLFNLDQTAYNNIREFFLSKAEIVRRRTDLGDFSDDRKFRQVLSILNFSESEKQVYESYQLALSNKKSTLNFSELVQQAFDSIESNPKFSLELVNQINVDSLNNTNNEKQSIECILNNIKSKAYNRLGNFNLALTYADRCLQSNFLDNVSRQSMSLERLLFLQICHEREKHC
ncbi:MAG: hypothetical protein QM764_07070 [Chitinophagaceae bacterium]